MSHDDRTAQVSVLSRNGSGRHRVRRRGAHGELAQQPVRYRERASDPRPPPRCPSERTGQRHGQRVDVADGDQMRNRSTYLLVLPLGAALFSCTRTAWYKDGASAHDYRRESYECERDMRQSGYFGTGYLGQANAAGFFERCMEAQGWEQRTVESHRRRDERERQRSDTVRAQREDYEARLEQQRTEKELSRRSREAVVRRDAGVETAAQPSTVGRCSETEFRTMLKQGMSGSAIEAACFAE